MPVPDPEAVLELIEAFRRSKTMFTAVRLGVFDSLQSRPATAWELAGTLGLNESALQRLLDGCTGLQLVERDAGGRYANHPTASAYLCRNSPDTLAGYILYSDQALFPMWAHLDDAVREGTPRWLETFALEGSIFSSFYRTPEARAEFLLGMHGLGRLTSPKVVRAFDLGRFRHLVDLGGGTGHLACCACEVFPELRATVFDLAAVIEDVRPFVTHPRVTLAAGDLFDGPLPPADLYTLGRILHDWSEDKIRLLLAKVHAALPPGGALLVVEKLLDEDRCGPVSAQMQSLNMLICTEGRERTLTEYRALLLEAGFAEADGRRTGAWLDAVLAVKAGVAPPG